MKAGPTLTLLHTNDFHGRLRPPATDALRRLREEHPDALLLDAGDAVTAGNLGFRLTGEPILDTMSDLGYSAMCLGNRETHPRKEIFPIKVAGARFPILCGNLMPKGDAPVPTVPSLRLELGGIRLGICAATVPMFTRKQWSQSLCDYWFEDPITSVCAQAEVLRPEVDVLIALTHIGFQRDVRLAEQCPELDLIVGGHSHTDLEEPYRVGHCAVVQARSHAFFAGVATLEVADGRGELRAWRKEPLRDAPA